MPDTAEYLARICQYVQAKEPVAPQRETPKVLAVLIAKTSDEQLTIRPGKDKWSVGEILAHLAEDEIATAWRYRQMWSTAGRAAANSISRGSRGRGVAKVG